MERIIINKNKKKMDDTRNWPSQGGWGQALGKVLKLCIVR